MKYLFGIMLLAHGLIHLSGHTEVLHTGSITQMTKVLSKPAGITGMIATSFLLSSSIMFFLDKSYWPYFAILGVIASQTLILMVWDDAKFGTIVNVIILIVALLTWSSQRFEAQFYRDVESQFNKSHSAKNNMLTESDVRHLPAPVKNYLRYVDVLNKPHVKNVRIMFDGSMRGKNKEWFDFYSIQYNFFDHPARFFFMKANIWGITIQGYHKYLDGNATMDIRLFGLFPLFSVQGSEMNVAETVTFFNDMCLFAPASLIDKHIEWNEVDEWSASATFSNGPHQITATLYFDESGQLVNFISDDRYDINEKKQYRFSTPVKDYQLFAGIRAPSYGEAIWHYPEGEFIYGKFILKTIDFNVNDMSK